MVQKPLTRKAEETIRTLPFRAGAIMLLLLYMAAFVYSPVGVPHLHHEDNVHDTDSCSKDPCHISIYHPGSEGGCKHKSHLTKAKAECDLCKMALPRQILTWEIVYTELANECASYFFNHTSNRWSYALLLHADRGPPFLI